MRYVCSGCDIRASHFHLTLFFGKQHKINPHPLDKNYKSGSRRVLQMRRGANTFPSHNRLPNPRFGCETLSFPFLFSGLLRAFPFPPLGWITHGGDSSVIFFRRLFFRALYFSGCDSWRLCWGPGFPKRVPPSFCSLFVYWVFMLLYSYLFTCFTLLHCVHIIVVSVGWLWLLGDLCEMSSIPELECT
jgi:hypothetical protein